MRLLLGNILPYSSQLDNINETSDFRVCFHYFSPRNILPFLSVHCTDWICCILNLLLRTDVCELLWCLQCRCSLPGCLIMSVRRGDLFVWRATTPGLPAWGAQMHKLSCADRTSTLVAFTIQLRKTNVSFVISLRPSVRRSARMNQFDYLWTVKVNQSHCRPEVPRAFQEVKVLRILDKGTGWW